MTMQDNLISRIISLTEKYKLSSTSRNMKSMNDVISYLTEIFTQIPA